MIMGIGLSFYMNPKLAFVFVVCTPILAIILFLIVHKVAPMYTRLQSIMDRLNQVVQENLTAIRAVKAFVRDEYEEDKFEEVNRDMAKSSETTFHYAVLNLPTFQGIMYTTIVMILWFGIATPLPLVHGVETATGIVLEQSTEELHATPMYRAVFGTETAQSEVE